MKKPFRSLKFLFYFIQYLNYKNLKYSKHIFKTMQKLWTRDSMAYIFFLEIFITFFHFFLHLSLV